MGKKHFYIGIDIGGTNIITVLVDKAGEIYFTEEIETKKYLNPKRLVAKQLKIIESIRELNRTKTITGIGIGSAGIIDSKRGIIKFSPNIGWKNFNIAEIITKESKLPVVVDNDANAACWGIYYLNYSKKYSNFLCITLGTGIGGGLILSGKLYRGADGYAGEIGHMTLVPDGWPCSCGSSGCLESYAGTKGIIKRTRLRLKQGAKSLIELNDNITPHLLEQAAANGDKTALAIWRETGEMIGTTLASVINLLNLELIYITGGIAHAQKWIEDPIKRTIKKRAFSDPAHEVKIVFAKQKKDMGVIGSGLLVLEKHLHSTTLK
ncbi:ROK family protein [bacterium]